MSETSFPGVTRSDTCESCTGMADLTPAPIDNRPGLETIAYRVGTYGKFLDSMRARLSSDDLPELSGLQTRDGDDFSLALLDAWASLADVLTFYQERIANESYLRTATERRSLLEQARLIGYELRPGVAAATFLAFTLEESPGSPRRSTIDAGAKVQSIPGPNEKPQTFETTETIEARVEWNALRPKVSHLVLPDSRSTRVYLQGTSTNLKVGDALLLVGVEREKFPGSERWDFRRVTAVHLDHQAHRTRVEWSEPLGHESPRVLPSAQPRVYALRQRAALFGHQAPHPKTLASATLTNYGISPKQDWPFVIDAATIDLDAAYPAILPESWIVLSRPGYQELYRASNVSESARADFTLVSKTTRITLDTTENLALFQRSHYRGATVFAQSELLEIAEEPLTEPIAGAVVELSAAPRDLEIGRRLAVWGTDAASGALTSEVVELADVNGATLTLKSPLLRRYVRDTLVLCANVVRATHGESVREVLGSGNASSVFQTFTLRQAPLTYVSAGNSTGAESTLRIYVNDMQWQEVDAFYGRGPSEHVFVTRTGDDARTTVQFGDGISGARLPTGQDNVRADYRKGIGLEGLVRDEQLSLLMTRPLGVKSVVNPIAATGGADRETLADARRTAPLTVLTLDRLVALRDYEDFTRAFAGIAKALATSSGRGRHRRVFLTVAGPNAAAVAPGSDLYKNLVDALELAGDPFVQFHVESFRDARFRIAGGFRVARDYLPEKVKAAVDVALQSRFSFDARDFGQAVALSEVIAVVQSVPGVLMVDIDELKRTTGQGLVHGRLLASLPDDDLAAELLTLEPASLVDVKVIS